MMRVAVPMSGQPRRVWHLPPDVPARVPGLVTQILLRQRAPHPAVFPWGFAWTLARVCLPPASRCRPLQQPVEANDKP